MDFIGFPSLVCAIITSYLEEKSLPFKNTTDDTDYTGFTGKVKITIVQVYRQIDRQKDISFFFQSKILVHS